MINLDKSENWDNWEDWVETKKAHYGSKNRHESLWGYY